MVTRPDALRRARALAPAQRGFTLIELLIVVIILGILAAIVIPRFSDMSSEAREAAVRTDLKMVRTAIDMYRMQHDDKYPTAAIVDQLTAMTDRAGAAGSTYGPYLRSAFPKNPMAENDLVKVVSSLPGSASGTEGWVYDTSTGTFRMNTAGTAPSGQSWFDF